jgi:hypothetical protein
MTVKGRASGKHWASALIQVALFVASTYFIWHAWAGAAVSQPISYSEFIENVRQGRVEAVQISATELRGRLRQEGGAAQPTGEPTPRAGIILAALPPDVYDPERQLERLRKRLAAEPVSDHALAKA